MRDELSIVNQTRAISGHTPFVWGWIWLIVIGGLLLTAGLWAHWAVLDEVTTGEGKVVPTSRLQVVQSPYGGIVQTINVKDGELVEKGQILLSLDDRDARSQLGELRQRQLALKAQNIRLTAEAENKSDLAFPPELEADAPGIVAAERASFAARRAKSLQDVNDLRSELLQHEQEMRELEAQQKRLTESLGLMERELAISRKLAKSGAIPEIDLIKLERQYVDARGELDVLTASQPRLALIVDQARAKLDAGLNTLQASVREDLVKNIGELSVLEESMFAVELRVNRTELRAPVRGIVNRLAVSSIGGVVQPGSTIVEIVPAEESLLVEVKVGPRDIGFISKGQPARVKLTAFDFLQYGWLDGVVDRIGADTLLDAENHAYYLVTVRTNESTMGRNGSSVRIIPGMVATVDILTGQKSVLQYLISPLLRTSHEALRER